MDIKTRKLNLIESLITIQDERLFDQIEDLIQNRVKGRERLYPITEKNLVERAVKSNEDFLAGRIVTQEELEVQSEKWGTDEDCLD